MRRVVIESPFAGDTARNVIYAQEALKDSLLRGEAPLASHLLYTQVLDDRNQDERRLGITAGHAWIPYAEVLVVYSDFGITSGMNQAVQIAEERRIPVEYRKIRNGEKK